MTQFTPPVLPVALTTCRNWLVWRLVHKEGQPKPSKVPYYVSGPARPGTQGTPEDLAALATFDEACAAVVRSQGWDRPYTGIGFAPQADSGIVALDFDNCVVDGALAAHVDALCEGTYTEFSPSGTGARAFFTGTLLSRKDVDAKLGPYPIEVFGHNGFVTVTGNVTPAAQMFGWDQVVAPLSAAVYRMYRERGWDSTQVPGAVADNVLMALVPTLGFDAAKVALLLADLPADLDYDSWVKTGMAVHHELGDAGFDTWHAWSMASPKYTTEKYCRDRWASFGRYSSGSHITMAWVVKQANEAQAHRKYDAARELKQRIAESGDEFILREKICPLIARDDRIGDMERERLAQALFDRFKGLGTKYPIAQCRKLIAVRRDVRSTSDLTLPEWLVGWVYVTEDDKFYRVDSDEWLTSQSFNARFNRFMPRGEGGTVDKSATWTALEDYQIEPVTRGVYLPWAESTFDLHGVRCVNIYRPSSVPTAVGRLSQVGKDAVALVQRHLNLICGGRREVVDILLAWMAHNVQRPGIKIRWSPLIKGIPGDGKTLIGQVLTAVLGQPNVKQISPKVLGTDFSDWAHGACVGVLEEIKLTGHNRHDIFNALKPNITNDVIPIHPKGGAEYNVINTMNYVAFTNHGDALPIDDTDRRFMILFSPFASRADLDRAIRALGVADSGAYFDALHEAISAQRAELRRWLLDHPLPESFKPNGAAPDTPERAQMIGMNISQDEELVRELIAEGGEGIGGAVLSATCLAEAALVADASVSLKTTSINRVLGRLGWQKVPDKVKWKGRTHRVWVYGKVPSENEAIRASLDLTVQKIASSPNLGSEIINLFNSEPNSEPLQPIDLFG